MLRGWTLLSKKLLLSQTIATVILANTLSLNAYAAPKTDELMASALFQQQNVSLTGTVTDETNQPMPGVAVTVKGTTNGVITDASGKYSIQGANNATLVFSLIGYQSQELQASSGLVINVKLQPVQTELNEVVVVGYGTQRRATVTGSVSQISGNEVAKSPAANVTSSLQGRLPGLIANQRNGQPGRDDPNILIRGTGTVPAPGGNFNDLLAANAPLIVIDGVPRDQLGRLNPADIETFTVLKDASAAIYGARAANGVILVTTKSGTRGKADFNFSYNYALNSPTKVPDVLDAATYAEVYNEGVFYRAGRDLTKYTPQYSAAAIQKFRDGSDPVLFPNTNWTKEVLKPTSFQRNMNFQVNGGSDKTRYLVSFSNLEQNGNFRAEPTYYRQYNIRSKVDINLTDNLSVGVNISAILNERNYSSTNQNTNFVNILQANPTLVARYPNGLLGGGRLGQSPLLLDQRGYDKTDDYPIYSTFTATYKVPFVKGLRLDGSFNYDIRNTYQKVWETPYFYYEYNTTTAGYDKKQVPPLTASLRNRAERRITSLYNIRATYEKDFTGGHHMSAMLGIEQQQNSYSFLEAFRKNYLSSKLDQINQGSTSAEDKDNAGSSSLGAYNNYLGRLNYDYKSKYLLEFVFRYDGSQVFPTSKRYGFFPGLSAGWRISEEEFFKKAFPFVDQLKLRASYGQLGNDRIAQYQYLQLFAQNEPSDPPGSPSRSFVFGSTNVPVLISSVLANPNVTWERATKTDIGVEAQLWNGKLGIDFTYWTQVRNNILIRRNLSIASAFGFPGLPYENLGKVNTHGIELILSHRNKIGEFSYSLSGNVAYSRSKVGFLDEVPPAQDYQMLTGNPVSSDLYYQADGIFNTKTELDSYPHDANTQIGDIKIVDLNNDGVINDNDRFRLQYNAIPRYVFGLNTDFQYKNFDLNVFFQGQTGAYNYDGTVAALGGQDFSNSSVFRATDRWSESNPNGTMPRADAYQRGNTTFFLYDATFVRLKTVEFGYTFPKPLLDRSKFLKTFRIYVSAFNLATWSKDIKFADPEFNGGYLTYPQQRTINFGASIKF